jgi:hypothetical protein
VNYQGYEREEKMKTFLQWWDDQPNDYIVNRNDPDSCPVSQWLEQERGMKVVHVDRYKLMLRGPNGRFLPTQEPPQWMKDVIKAIDGKGTGCSKGYLDVFVQAVFK